MLMFSTLVLLYLVLVGVFVGIHIHQHAGNTVTAPEPYVPISRMIGRFPTGFL